MGLREYEFDVSPELIATLVRRRPGPLMDAAMRHVASIVDSHSQILMRRLHAMLEHIRGRIEGDLAGTEANFGSVSDRGVFRQGSLSERIGGPRDSLGVVAGLTPRGRNYGWEFAPERMQRWGAFGIPWSLVGGGFSSEQNWTSNPEYDEQKSSLVSRIGAQLVSALYAGSRAERALQRAEMDERDSRGRPTTGSPGHSSPWRQVAADEAGQQAEHLAEVRRLQAALDALVQSTHVQRENPDAPSTTTRPTSAVEAFALFQFLKSNGGLGPGEVARTGTRLGTTPAILNAVDPSPENDNTPSSAELIRIWMLDLVDPPEAL